MLRALIIGDVHWRMENPVARTDNYMKTVREKLLECFRLAENFGVNAIIQTGDLFDSPGIALTTIGDLVKVFQNSPAPIYAIAGNHDLYGHNPESLYRTPIGLLFHLGVIKNLETDAAYFTEFIRNPFERPDGVITGSHYSPMVDVEGFPYRVSSVNQYGHEYENDFRIHVTHGMLTNDAVPSRHTLISDLANMDDVPDVVINGHYHLGTGIQTVGSTMVINPGALVRTKADLREIDRTVNVAFLEVHIDGEVNAELIPLKSTRPGSEVLSREHLIVEAERQNRNQQFMDLVMGERRESLDVSSMVEEVAQMEKAPENVRTGALERVGKAIEELAESGVRG